MKYFINVLFIALCVWQVHGVETIMPPQAFKANIPSGNYYLQSVLSYHGNAIRLGKAPKLWIESTLCIPASSFGEQSLCVEGRAFSPQSSATIRISARGLHAPKEQCSGNSDSDLNHFTFKLQLPADQKAAVKFPLPLQAEDFVCEQCEMPLKHCHITLFLSIDPIPAGVDLDQWGFELSKISFVTDEFSTATALQFPRLGLVEQVAAEREAFVQWQKEHQRILRKYPGTNRFNASTLNIDDWKMNSDDFNYRYFTQEELQQLNPQFSIKKLAGWNFYQDQVFWQISPEINGLNNVEDVFICNNVLYACACYRIARWNPDNKNWDYLKDQWSKHPVKEFPNEARRVQIVNHKAYRLSDYSEVAIPNASRFQYAKVGDRTFWIAPGRKDLFCGDSDFSNPQSMKLVPPKFPHAHNWEIRNIFSCFDQQRLLLEYTAFLPETLVPVLMELDISNHKMTSKLPIIEEYYSLQPQENGWSFFSELGTLYDVGKDRPLMVLHGTEKQHSLHSKLCPPVLELSSKYDERLRNSIRLGVYAVTLEGTPTLLNLFAPEQSLRIYGVEQRRKIVLNADASALLILMPDGVYEFRPNEMPAVPFIEPSRSPSPSLSPTPDDLIAEIEADTPTLFNARKADHKIIFSICPTAAPTLVTLHLQLPEADQCYTVRFNQAVSHIFQPHSESADGSGNLSSWLDEKTLCISGKTVKLDVELSVQHSTEQILLESILPEKQSQTKE